MIRVVMVMALMVVGPAQALEMVDCTRVTHPAHGGEAAHADHGDGWVSWTTWWSHQGVYSDLHVADCQAGKQLVTRLQEVGIRRDVEFDRRAAGAERLDRHLRRAPSLRALPDLAEEIALVGDRTRLEALATEPCACAAAYPGARGDLEPFALN